VTALVAVDMVEIFFAEVVRVNVDDHCISLNGRQAALHFPLSGAGAQEKRRLRYFDAKIECPLAIIARYKSPRPIFAWAQSPS
jgi:hypothetical protein